MTAPITLTPGLLLRAYASGIFPMAESRAEAEIFWVDPTRRGIIPLDGFHISRSLARRIRSRRFRVTADADFCAVLDACADRDETWISADIAAAYRSLWLAGHGHSVEVWDGDALAGGVYGVTLGRAFFGESMFSRRTDASKVALAYLVDRLRRGGFVLFDTQFLTAHLASLGAVEVSREDYQRQLRQAVSGQSDFRTPTVPAPDQLLQRMTQTS